MPHLPQADDRPVPSTTNGLVLLGSLRADLLNAGMHNGRSRSGWLLLGPSKALKPTVVICSVVNDDHRRKARAAGSVYAGSL
jgi:hypothetical protein